MEASQAKQGPHSFEEFFRGTREAPEFSVVLIGKIEICLFLKDFKTANRTDRGLHICHFAGLAVDAKVSIA